MASDSFLRLKGRTSYFRRKIPLRLQTQLASSEICFKLGVIDRDSAVLLARRLAVDVDAFFVSARENSMLSSNDLSALLSAGLQGWRDNIQPVPMSVHVSTKKQATGMAALASDLLARQANGHAVVDDAFIREKLVAAGLNTEMDPVALRVAGSALASGMAAHFFETAAQLARQSGLDRGLFKLPADAWEDRAARLLDPFSLQDGVSVREGGATAVDAHPEPAAPASSSPPATLPVPATTSNTAAGDEGATRFDREGGAVFSSQALYLVRERISIQELTPGAEHNIRSSLRLWLQICGDLDIRQYGDRHMAEFRSVLISVPKMFWRSKAEQEKHILQVISEAEAKDSNYQRIQNKTINKHISNINGTLEYARAVKIIDRSQGNLAGGLYLPKGAEVTGLDEHEERPGYTPEQITRFFDHPVYQGRKSHYFYNDPGDQIYRDAKYWVPILACFELMRREEICQIKRKHVVKQDGIHYFDLMHHEIRVKRKSSKRIVPFHDGLLALGFMDEVVAGLGPEDYLFPELRPNARGVMSDGVGRQVGRMVESLGIQLIRVDDTEVDGALHPFRHSGITYFQNQMVTGGIIDALTGHASKERKSERRRYTDKIYLEVLHETINRLVVPVDVEALNRKWRELGRPSPEK